MIAASEGYIFQDFNANIGWEEGVVEQLERLFRKRILDRIGANVDYELLAALDLNHPFDRYISELEKIRDGMKRQPDEFYVSLAQIAIKARYSSLIEYAWRMPDRERRSLLVTLSAARPVLEDRIH